MSKITKALDAVKSTIDREGDPKRMTKAEYKDFLEEIETEVEGRLDGVKAELKEEDEG